MKNNESIFLNLLDAYVSKYLPISVGASPNTIKSYKTTYRLLIEFMYTNKNVNANCITFDMLNQETLLDFFEWIEIERSCSISTRNQRQSALLSFSAFAQNRNFEAATVFSNVTCNSASGIVDEIQHPNSYFHQWGSYFSILTYH